MSDSEPDDDVGGGACCGGVVDLTGERTSMHDNEVDGMYAVFSGNTINV